MNNCENTWIIGFVIIVIRQVILFSLLVHALFLIRWFSYSVQQFYHYDFYFSFALVFCSLFMWFCSHFIFVFSRYLSARFS
jgi:hypothetical protein